MPEEWTRQCFYLDYCIRMDMWKRNAKLRTPNTHNISFSFLELTLFSLGFWTKAPPCGQIAEYRREKETWKRRVRWSQVGNVFGSLQMFSEDLLVYGTKLSMKRGRWGKEQTETRKQQHNNLPKEFLFPASQIFLLPFEQETTPLSTVQHINNRIRITERLPTS